ncbi:MAG: PAS domain-containing protein [Rhodospirillaceae bacterium]|nr:PAS domain-containing protein [Rhodospirillaceae bacterium]MBT5242014.1 PAS domain-containing protein [Rhodospirillaceae bacterium]MBT5565739.1 PAS domain-containing protein [Rhodospirillaceae bacterium]MBT6088534.1 PAS domain-containing protein [Rhodospirillaceae bacterium]MBT7449600.1 PAS domain-containing protein [Rhodospirillaceae bacterium]
MTILASPIWLAVAGAFVLIVLPAIAVLIWQHRGWRTTEHRLLSTEDRLAAMWAALDASPDGYFGWLESENNSGQCSRRLAVLLDLYRGIDATFEDVVDGFDNESGERLSAVIETLRRDGRGFTIELNHAATGRRIEGRGVRASTDDDILSVDMVWMSDVTEGVAAVDTLTKENQRLIEKNDRLQSALDGLVSPVWLRDDDLSLIYCNAAYVRAVDARSSSDVTSRGREIAPRAAVREVRALAAAARASGITRSAPFHMVIDGSRRLMEVTENPVSLNRHEDDSNKSEYGEDTPSLFGDGSGLMTAGVAYDVTRQEELETRLSRETASHAEVLERLGTAIAVFGADQRLAFHNTAFTQLWGLDRRWLSDGPSYGDVLEALRDQRRLPEVADFPAFKEKELDRFHSLIDPLEDVMHLPDGVTLRRVVAPHPMGGLLTTYEDVTDTLAMERSYNTLIAVQRETIDNLNEAIAVFSDDGQLQLANPAFLSLWDLPRTLVGEQTSITDVMDKTADLFADQESLTGYRSLVLGALAPESERLTRQARFERRDGIVIEVVAAPLPDGGVLFSYDDVSDPARVESALRTRARALSVNEKLRSAFIADAMEELRTPLSALMDQDQGGASLTPISIADLLKLIDDIGELAALDSDKETLKLDSLDLRAAIDSVKSLTRETFKAREWSVETSCAESVDWIVGDNQRIRQMLYHLVVGALHGAPSGSKASLTIDRTNGQGATSNLSIEVIGPSNPNQDEELRWAGLALVRHVAELHGGYTDAEILEDGSRRVACTLPDGT